MNIIRIKKLVVGLELLLLSCLFPTNFTRSPHLGFTGFPNTIFLLPRSTHRGGQVATPVFIAFCDYQHDLISHHCYYPHGDHHTNNKQQAIRTPVSHHHYFFLLLLLLPLQLAPPPPSPAAGATACWHHRPLLSCLFPTHSTRSPHLGITGFPTTYFCHHVTATNKNRFADYRL